MTSLLFPIGHDLGTHHLGTHHLDEPARGGVERVRFGNEIIRLDGQEFAVWALAHGIPAEPGLASAWDRARVEEIAARCEIEDPPAVVDRLLGCGLLAQVELDDPAGIADFAIRHRLLPLHLGLGNSAESKGVFDIGTTGRPLVSMPWMLYEIWLTGHLTPNLLAACEQRVILAREGDLPAADTLDPERLLAGTLEFLHTLLPVGAACLDLAMPEEQP